MFLKVKTLCEFILTTSASLVVSSIFWPTILIVSSLLFLFRYFIQKLLNLLFGQGKFILACGIDSLFAYDKVQNSSAIIHTVLVIKGQPNLAKIRQRYSDNVFQFRESNSSTSSNSSTKESPPLYAQRLQKTFTKKLGFACWKDTSMSFDLNRHVRYMEGLEIDDGLDGLGGDKHPITEDKLLRMISSLMDEGVLFRNEHPQWEHLIIPNYSVENSSSPHFACIIRVHHAYADGASFGLLIDSVLSDSPISFAIDPLKPFPGHKWWNSAVSHLKAGLFGPMAFCLTLKSAIRDRSKLILKRYSGRKHLSWSDPIDMNFLKDVRRASGTSVASILITALTGAIRKLHVDRKSEFGELPETINIGNMSLMLPYKSRQFQNHFTTFSIPCPLGCQDVESRLRETDEITRRISFSSEPIFNFFIMRFAGYLPICVQNLLADLAGTPALFSNVPGAKAPFGVFGGLVTDAGAWLPLVKTYGMGIATYSYCDQMRLCISADSFLFQRQSDLKSFIDDVESELKRLGEVFGLQLPSRNNKFIKYTNLNYKGLAHRKPYPTA